METALVIGFALWIVSEILPYTPLKGNGIIQQIISVGRTMFPYSSDADK